MRITLSTTLEGSAAQEVQTRLKKAIEATGETFNLYKFIGNY